jgi:hypothetical protein
MITIACPVYKRDWILPAWFHFIENQSYSLDKIGFLFELGTDDQKTYEVLLAWKRMHPEVKIFDLEVRDDLTHSSHEEGTRRWTHDKYHNMISMRNSLLDKVKEIKPDAHLSLDSDILLTNPNTIELLLSHIHSGADAVNPLMFMTPFDTRFPSVMSWIPNSGYEKAQRLEQYPLGRYFKSDVIMAAKMMSSDVYMNSRYEFHPQGEDLGWSKSCAEKGYELFCASYIYSPHIMGKSHMVDFLKNGDARQQVTYQVS